MSGSPFDFTPTYDTGCTSITYIVEKLSGPKTVA
jgi:hypothetical protein